MEHRRQDNRRIEPERTGRVLTPTSFCNFLVVKICMEFQTEKTTRTEVCEVEEDSGVREVLYGVESLVYSHEYSDFELLSRRQKVEGEEVLSDTYFLECPASIFPEEMVYAALEDRFEKHDRVKIKEADLNGEVDSRVGEVADFTEADQSVEQKAMFKRINVSKDISSEDMREEFVILSYMRSYSPTLFLASNEPGNLNLSTYHDSERSGIPDSDLSTLANEALEVVQEHDLEHI